MCMKLEFSENDEKKHSAKCSWDLATVQGGEIALEKAGFPTKPVFPCRHLTWAHHIQAFSRNRQALLLTEVSARGLQFCSFLDFQKNQMEIFTVDIGIKSVYF